MYIFYITILCCVFTTVLRTEATPCDEIVNLKKLLKTQRYMLEYLDSYMIDLHKDHRGTLKSYLNRYQTEQTKALANVAGYLANPINCYVLIKGLSRDLNHTEHLLKQFTAYQRKPDIPFPTTEEYHLAAGHITNLVFVYNLNVAALARGNLTVNFRKDQKNITMITTPMTSSDCYELGMTAFDNHENETALAWLMESLKRYQNDCSDYRCRYTEGNVLLFISIVYFEMGRYKTSLSWLERIKTAKEVQQDSATYEKQRAYIVNAMKQPRQSIQQKKHTPINLINREYCLQEHINHKRYFIVIGLRLYCQYRYGPHPFLRLARFKAELLQLDPEVTMFYDVISNKEIRTVKGLAEEKIKDEKMSKKCLISGELKILDARQEVYISDQVSKVAAAISRRSLDISGLNSTFAENVKVVHYPVTGFHRLHFMCAGYSHSTHDMPCIPAHATVVYYLTEPDLGGATAFSNPSLSVFPVKNSALYWRNVSPSKNMNHSSLYMDCPVLLGSKWIVSKWLSDVQLVESIKNRLSASGNTLETNLKLYPLSYESLSQSR